MFPFLAADATIYFASNGHVGMGGFDIYESYISDHMPVYLSFPIKNY